MPAKKTAAAKKTTKTTAAKTTAAKKPAAKKKPAATKSTATKKPATKKTTAATKSSTKTSTKKATKGKTAATKTAAKKPAAKKTAAKKAPRKTATKSKTTSKAKTTKVTKTDTATAPKTSKAKVPFKVGDKVVYPHHGAATIVKKERIEFDGEKTDYFVLEIATDQLVVRVPTERAVERGVRPVISKTVARKVFQTFKDEPQEAGSNWSRWYKLLTEKINSGDIFQVAEVVRDLTYAQQIKGISPALKRMLAKARLIIISELRFALNLDEEDAIKKLDRALPKVEIPEDE